MSPTRSGLVVRALLAASWFALVFFVALPAGVLAAAGGSWPRELGPLSALGLAVIALAHCVLVPHVAAFVRLGEGTHAPLAPPRHLVTAGLYGRVRNPMYWVYTAIIAGEALFFASWALAAYACAFWLLAHLYVVRVEERALRARFGQSWERYARRVGRWLPRPGPRC